MVGVTAFGGWVLHLLHQSGEVEIGLYGFSEAFGPTTLLQKLELKH